MDDDYIYGLLRTPMEHLTLDELRTLEYAFHNPGTETPPLNCDQHYDPWPELGTCVFHEPGDPRARFFVTLRDQRLLETLILPDVPQE